MLHGNKEFQLELGGIRRQLKKTIETLEMENIEVHEEIYSAYSESMNAGEEGHGWRHYSICSNSGILPFYQNCRTLLQHGTTGLCAWPAAWRLAEFAKSKPTLFEEKSLLELGSGLGAGGVFVSHLTNPSKIVLTDVHSEVLQMLKLNSTALRSVHPELKVEVAELDWCSFVPTDLMWMILQTDVVIGADLLYDPSVFPDLVKLLSAIFHIKCGIQIYLAATIRNLETWNNFRDLCQKENILISKFDSTKIPEIFHFDRETEIIIVSITIGETV